MTATDPAHAQTSPIATMVQGLLRGERPPTGATTLDGGPVRTTMRLPIADQTVVVKLFHPRRGLSESLRSGLKTNRAVTEARNLEQALGRGLPVPTPLDVLRVGALRSGLVLEDLGPVTPLDEYVDESVDRGSLLLGKTDHGIAVLEQAGELLHRALEAGLDHRDLHLGNIVRRDGSGELFLLDLHRARFRNRPVTLSQQARVSLFLSLPWPDQRPWRDALARGLRTDSLLPSDPAPLIARHIQKRHARCRRASGAFVLDGSRRVRRARSGFAPGTSEELPAGLATRQFEGAFLLEVHGIPTARALALEPVPGGLLRLTLESCAGFEPVAGSPRSEDCVERWLARLRQSGHEAAAARLLLLGDADGRRMLVDSDLGRWTASVTAP